MGSFPDKSTNAFRHFPGLVSFVKEPASADNIKDQVLLVEKTLLSLRLWTVIIGKKKVIAGELLESRGIIFQALEKVDNRGHGLLR
jgi:hypothetical protein